MNIIEEVRHRLQRYPMLKYRENGDLITVDPINECGFSVSMGIHRNEFIVSFDGWHEHFKTEDEALNCFAYGLSEQCRLKVHRTQGFEYCWTLEHLSDTGWKSVSSTIRLFFPFWRKRDIIYRQNSILSASNEAANP